MLARSEHRPLSLDECIVGQSDPENPRTKNPTGSEQPSGDQWRRTGSRDEHRHLFQRGTTVEDSWRAPDRVVLHLDGRI